jgi:hypothetical protein
MRCFLLFAALTATCLSAWAAPLPAAAQIRLEGRVVDDATNLSIAGARVEIFDFTWQKLGQRVTDAQGGFAYPLRRPGSYHIRVGRTGYARTTPRLVTGAHSYINVEVRLKSDAVLMAPLTVVARSSALTSPVLDNFHERMRLGMGTYITREDMQRMRPYAVSDVVTRVPGLFMASSGGTGRHIFSGRTQGSAPGCPAQIYVDGFLLNPVSRISGETEGMTLDEAVRPQDVEGIEIYHGLSTVPAEFLTTESRCAVIAVWTRRGPSAR